MKLKNVIDHKTRALKLGIPAVQAQNLALSSERIIENYHLNKVRGVYNTKGALVPSLHHGRFVRKDKMQNRIVTKAFPIAGRGRPRKDEVRVLVSYLAWAFCKATQKPITLNQKEMKPSNFQAYIEPILNSVGLFDVRGYITDHMNARKKLK
jgi:hypothetical protein